MLVNNIPWQPTAARRAAVFLALSLGAVVLLGRVNLKSPCGERVFERGAATAGHIDNLSTDITSSASELHQEGLMIVYSEKDSSSNTTSVPGNGTGENISGTSPGVCHPDCTKFGNCGENGECRCPFGRLGEACEIDFLSPCKNDKNGLPNCGFSLTKSCECLRRCQQYFCRPLPDGTEVCEFTGIDFRGRDDVACYEREGVLPDEQFSIIPEPEEMGVTCFSGHKPGALPLSCSDALQSGDKSNVPMSLCPNTNSCNTRGYCTRPPEQKEGNGSCRCHRGHAGINCEVEAPACYQNCSGRGQCIDQFCHCEPPYFSIGCTRSKVYPINYSSPSPVDFKIYMYELNTQLAYDNAAYYGHVQHDESYIAYQLFMKQFLVSHVRTEDPSEANVYFVPSFNYGYSGNVGSGQEHMELLLDHIKHAHPYWNRTGGRDHFFWAPADRGACLLSGLSSAAIRVVHFGHHSTQDNAGPLGHIGHKVYGCFHPQKDVVAASYLPGDGPLLERTVNTTVEELIHSKNDTRLFFFAGGVRTDPEYSGGTRQILHKLMEEWNDPEFDWLLGHIGAEYEERMQTSKFCLAPFGHGFGNRVLQSMVSGCVPVILQEHVFQPYEDILPYENFSIRLNNRDLPHLREILRRVSKEQYRELLQGVKRYCKAFSWNMEKGGEAFKYTLLALRRRHMNMKALHY